MTTKTKTVERPILFKGEMVRAILEGRKTNTRRLVKSQPPADSELVVEEFSPTKIDRHGDEYPGPSLFGAYSTDGLWGLRCPYGRPGDRLWVRESLYIDDFHCINKPPSSWPQTDIIREQIYYAADGDCCEQIPECMCATVGKPKFRPSIHMPRWASRITLEITDIGVEWLDEIDEESSIAEGCVAGRDSSAKSEFRSLWERINGSDSWNANPLVWVVKFTRVNP